MYVCVYVVYMCVCIYISHMWHIYLSIHPYSLGCPLTRLWGWSDSQRNYIDHLPMRSSLGPVPGHQSHLSDLASRPLLLTGVMWNKQDWTVRIGLTHWFCVTLTNMGHGTNSQLLSIHSSAPILGFEHWAGLGSCASVLWPRCYLQSTASKSGKDRNRHSFLELVTTCV